jgi:hypothetical protein
MNDLFDETPAPKPKLKLVEAIDLLERGYTIQPPELLDLLQRIQRGVTLMREQASAQGWELDAHRERAQVQRDEEIGRMGGGG